MTAFAQTFTLDVINLLSDTFFVFLFAVALDHIDHQQQQLLCTYLKKSNIKFLSKNRRE